jgi:transposase-like protein
MKNKHKTEQIIDILRQAHADLAKGSTVQQVCNRVGISEQTYYRWRNRYAEVKADDMKKLKDLERENHRLKKIIADQALEISLLKDSIKAKS